MPGLLRLFAAWSVALFLLGLSATGAFALTAGDVSFTFTTGNVASGNQKLIVDSNNCDVGEGPRAAYVGGIVTNTSLTTLSDLKAELTGLDTLAGFGFAGGQVPQQTIGSLAPGASVAVYWYITYPCTTDLTDAISFEFTDIGLGAVTSAANVTTISSISASAGGLVIVTTISAGNVIGSSVFFDVQYEFGNAAPDDEYFLQLAGNQSFDAACFRLKSVEILTSDVSAIPVGSIDQFYFQATGRQGGSGHVVDARYELVYMCAGASTTAQPYSAQTSGSTNLKYTGNFDSQPPVTFVPGVNPLTVEKTSSALILPPEGGLTTFTVTFTNSSTSETLLRRIEDTLPEGMVFGTTDFTSQVTESNSSAVPATGSTGTVIWESQPDVTWVVPANGTLSLRYNVALDAGDKVYSNSVVGVVGNETVGPATASVVVGTPTGATGTIVSDATVTAGDAITVSVEDADLDVDPLLADTITVQAVNDRTGEFETVILTETGPSTGVFTGTLPTLDQAAADLSDNGVMAAQGSDTVTFTYQDVLDGSGGAAAPTATTTITAPAPLTGVTGTITQDATIAAGAPLTITVTDADLDADPAVAETVVVTTLNEATGEVEAVTLTETGVNTGVFTASLTTLEGTGPGTDSDGTMVVTGGERLTTTYQDALTDTGATAAPTASTNVTTDASTITGSISASAAIAPGTGVEVTVSDADLDTDPALAETLTVTVENTRTGELETLTLTETGPATGVFSAKLPTLDATTTGPDDNGTLNVQAGDSLVSTYLDAADAGGAPATVTATTSVSAGGEIILQGRVILDNGAGGGTAHDGLYNGGEPRLGGRRVDLRAADGSLIASTDTLLDGSYAFTLDNSLAGTALTLSLVETLADERHVSSNPGPFSDADRQDGALTFTPEASTNYALLNFGMVQVPVLTADRQVAVQSGGRIDIGHRFIATSDMSVAFALANLVESTPGIAQVTLWRDLGCDFTLSPEDSALDAPVAAQAGEVICVLAAVQTSTSTPAGSSVSFDLTALATFTGTPVTSELANTDDVTIDGANALELDKQVCNLTQGPCDLSVGTGFSTQNTGGAGDVLIYRIGFRNSGSAPISAISVGDTTPAYTSLTATAPGVVTSPGAFPCTFATSPAPGGYQGGLEWRCSGTLLPEETGAVRPVQSSSRRSRRALAITETDDSDIAAAAIIGESSTPKTG
ncbi:beta strand repeat-containing protein [Marinovum sp.]|uniref:beta strand repeat-containing protein n=1 Tax=Marinovum sp. TaxID=2024839 RepID=UPI003A9315E6